MPSASKQASLLTLLPSEDLTGGHTIPPRIQNQLHAFRQLLAVLEHGLTLDEPLKAQLNELESRAEDTKKENHELELRLEALERQVAQAERKNGDLERLESASQVVHESLVALRVSDVVT